MTPCSELEARRTGQSSLSEGEAGLSSGVSACPWLSPRRSMVPSSLSWACIPLVPTHKDYSPGPYGYQDI